MVSKGERGIRNSVIRHASKFHDMDLMMGNPNLKLDTYVENRYVGTSRYSSWSLFRVFRHVENMNPDDELERALLPSGGVPAEPRGRKGGTYLASSQIPDFHVDPPFPVRWRPRL